MRTAVAHTVDFDRIKALPRRRLDAIDADGWATALTLQLRTNPRVKAELFPGQAIAIVEALENAGAWLALPVGFGKTLIYHSLITLVEAERTLVIVPASLEKKTHADFRGYRGTWKSPHTPYRVVSREWLQCAEQEHFIEQYAPKLLIVDESDQLANADSSTTARIDRYVVDHRDCMVVVGTGTPGRNSILNYWHLVMWCLRERAPLPLRRSEAEMLAWALDERVRNPALRPHPGPWGSTLHAAREWYRQRLADTPGIVIIDGDSCDQPLTIRTRLAREDSVLDHHFAEFGQYAKNPGGIVVSDPLSQWLLDSQLGSGYYTYYDPPPPDEWRDARRDLARLVRESIEASRRTARPLDTERQVIARHPDAPEVLRWKAVKGLFDPARHTKVAWLSDSSIQSCRDWLAEIDRPGIVWTGGVEFGQRLATVAGLAYYGRLGQSAGGVGLHEAPTGKSIVCSWQANKAGFNLQAWPRALIAQPPPSAKWLEQIIGRSHRLGAREPVVVDILFGSGGSIDAFEAAIREAGFVFRTLGLTEKILRASIERARPRITKSNRFRWASRVKTTG